MHIRLARPADLDALARRVAEMHEHERISTRPETFAALRALLGNGELGFVLVGTTGGPADALAGYAVIGFGYSLEFFGRDAFIDELYVVQAARGNGLGTAMMKEAEAEATRRGAKALHLEVDHANPDALRLYERTGYRSHPRHLMTKWLQR